MPIGFDLPPYPDSCFMTGKGKSGCGPRPHPTIQPFAKARTCIKQPHAFIFDHPQRCGGTSILSLLNENYIHFRLDEPFTYCSFTEIVDHLEEKDISYALSAHTFIFPKTFGNYPTFYFTLLRNPYEKFISLIKHTRQVGVDIDLSLDSYISFVDLFGQGSLDRAKENLEFGYSFFGITEHLGDAAHYISQACGMETGDISWVNASKYHLDIEKNIHTKFLDRYADDVKLYAWANDVFRKRLDDIPPYTAPCLNKKFALQKQYDVKLINGNKKYILKKAFGQRVHQTDEYLCLHNIRYSYYNYFFDSISILARYNRELALAIIAEVESWLASHDEHPFDDFIAACKKTRAEMESLHSPLPAHSAPPPFLCRPCIRDIAQFLAQKNQHEAAIDLLRRLKSPSYPFDPNDDECTIALLLSEAGRYEESDPIFRRILQANPGNYRFLNEYACSLFNRGQYDTLVALLKPYESGRSYSPLLKFQIARALYYRGDCDAALEYCVAAEETLPDSFQLTQLHAVILRARGKVDAARQLLLDTASRYNNLPAHKLELIATTAQCGDYDAAIEMIDSGRTLQLEDKNRSTFVNMKSYFTDIGQKIFLIAAPYIIVRYIEERHRYIFNDALLFAFGRTPMPVPPSAAYRCVTIDLGGKRYSQREHFSHLRRHIPEQARINSVTLLTTSHDLTGYAEFISAGRELTEGDLTHLSLEQLLDAEVHDCIQLL